jgi:hypothetical protein
MMVTAKFKVTRCDPQGDSDKPWAHNVLMTPDYSDGRNKEWAEATPAGSFQMTVKNILAVEQLPLGKSVTIQIIPDED